jgi:hypothetical protein
VNVSLIIIGRFGLTVVAEWRLIFGNLERGTVGRSSRRWPLLETLLTIASVWMLAGR